MCVQLNPTWKVGDVQFWKLPKEEQNQKYSFAFALQLGPSHPMPFI